MQQGLSLRRDLIYLVSSFFPLSVVSSKIMICVICDDTATASIPEQRINISNSYLKIHGDYIKSLMVINFKVII